METKLYDQIAQIEAFHWWYIGRRQIIFDWLRRILARYPHPRLLDIGCGTGYNLQILLQQGDVRLTGIDLSIEALRYCKQRHLTNLAAGDGVKLPFKNEAFDVILALDILEHIEEDIQALHEFNRVLRPGGSLILFTPAFQFLWGLQDEVSHHCRRYTASELCSRINQARFKIIKLSYANFFLFPLIWLGRLLMRLGDQRRKTISENDLTPAWSNGLLGWIFSLERPLLRGVNFPLGVSLLCILEKPVVRGW